MHPGLGDDETDWGLDDALPVLSNLPDAAVGFIRHTVVLEAPAELSAQDIERGSKCRLPTWCL